MPGPVEWAQRQVKRVSDAVSPEQISFRADMETEMKDEEFRRKNYKPKPRRTQTQRLMNSRKAPR